MRTLAGHMRNPVPIPEIAIMLSQTIPPSQGSPFAENNVNNIHLSRRVLLLNGVFGLQIPAGYLRTLFEDDFSKLQAGSRPSGDKWNITTGTSYTGGPSNWETNEVERYTD